MIPAEYAEFESTVTVGCVNFARARTKEETLVRIEANIREAAAQGIDILTIDDLIAATRAIRDQPAGREVRMRVLRGGKVVELATPWSGGPTTTPPR